MKYRIKGETKLHPTGMAAAMHHFCSSLVVVLRPGEDEITWMDVATGRIITVERVDVPEVAIRPKHFMHMGRKVVMA